MRIAYFDSFSGICGDMILGALVDAGLEIEKLKQGLEKLKLSGWRIKKKRIKKGPISATRIEVVTKEKERTRRLKDITSLIEKSALENKVKVLSAAIFFNLARAEAKVHGASLEEVHFHEVGAMDAIIDIVGAVVGIKELKIERICSSPLPLGKGFIQCRHGILPLPAPATLELLKNIPVYEKGVKEELVTPTGAAIISTLASSFGRMPRMRIERIGYGAGGRHLANPNLLRLIIGEDY